MYGNQVFHKKSTIKVSRRKLNLYNPKVNKILKNNRTLSNKKKYRIMMIHMITFIIYFENIYLDS